MEKSMRTDIFFFFFCDWIPKFFLLSLPFSSSFLLFSVHLYSTLFRSRLFGLGGVALSRQCGKMNFLKAKILQFFHTLEASTVLAC